MRATAYHFDSFRLIYGITAASVDSPQKIPGTRNLCLCIAKEFNVLKTEILLQININKISNGNAELFELF